MDGKDLLRRHKQLLHIKSPDTDYDERTGYDYLYEAARQWVIETECLTTTQSITTIASTATYTLNGDFLSLFLKENDRYYLKYNDGSDDYFIYFKPYQEVIFDNITGEASIPAYFTLTDDPTMDDLINKTSGAADGGAAVGGKSTLTFSTAIFGDVTPGDIIHNTTDTSDGIILSTESTAKILTTALFGGTGNDWDTDDAFIIQPRKRFLLQFEPVPQTANHTATIQYVKKPRPVYTDYDVYEIAYDYPDALCKYAAWLYKYRDQDPQFGDAFYKYWDKQLNDYRGLTNKGLARRSRIIPQWTR